MKVIHSTMATIWIPSLLRPLVDGQSQVVAPGRTVGDVIDALESAYPGLKSRLCQNDQRMSSIRLVPSIRALVDGRAALLGLAEPVGEHSEIVFVPAISGG